MPSDAKSFANFVRALVERYGDRIDGLEHWSEPNLINAQQANFRATPKEYRERILIPGFDAAKAVRPSLKVGAVGLYRSTEFERWLTDGDVLVRPLDMVTLHPYDDGTDEVADFIAAAHRFAARHSIPSVWVTEIGWDNLDSTCFHKTANPGRALSWALSLPAQRASRCSNECSFTT